MQKNNFYDKLLLYFHFCSGIFIEIKVKLLFFCFYDKDFIGLSIIRIKLSNKWKTSNLIAKNLILSYYLLMIDKI